MQAMQMVFAAIRLHLDSDAPDPTWHGKPGEFGFPYAVPWTFGKAFEKRILRMIEREETRFVRKVRKSRVRARQRQKAKMKRQRCATQCVYIERVSVIAERLSSDEHSFHLPAIRSLDISFTIAAFEGYR